MAKQAIIVVDGLGNHWLIPLCKHAVFKDRHQAGPVWAITDWEAGYYCSELAVEIVYCDYPEALISLFNVDLVTLSFPDPDICSDCPI